VIIIFKVIVAGSRNFSNYELLRDTLDRLLQNKLPNVTIVSGTANGADTLGEKYAVERNLELVEFPANWDKFGKSAGYRRNVEMADFSDGCVVFWDGVSKGTKHMIDIAEKKGLQLKVIKY
jgi:hypothetical protein